jgi:hypothetical protein
MKFSNQQQRHFKEIFDFFNGAPLKFSKIEQHVFNSFLTKKNLILVLYVKWTNNTEKLLDILSLTQILSMYIKYKGDQWLYCHIW